MLKKIKISSLLVLVLLILANFNLVYASNNLDSENDIVSIMSLGSTPKSIIPLNSNEGINIDNVKNPTNKILIINADNSIQKKETNEEFSYSPRNRDVSIVADVLDEYKAIEYIDFVKSLNPRIRELDKIRIRNDLFRELRRQATNEEVDERAYKEYGEKLDWKDAFIYVKDNIETLLSGLVERSERVSVNDLRNNKLRLFKSFTFLQKQYNFKFANIYAKDLILFHGEVFGSRISAYDRAINISNLSSYTIEMLTNLNAYRAVIRPITNHDLLDFIDLSLSIFDKDKDAKTWFLENTKAYVYETSSEHASSDIYEKFKKETRVLTHLIPLLNLSDDGIYLISTTTSINFGLVDTYLENRSADSVTEFKNKLEEFGIKQQAFLDFWYRISDKKDVLTSTDTVIVLDTMQRFGNRNQSARELWLPRFGQNTVNGIRNFMTPLNYYRDFIFIDGEASGNRVSLFLTKGLSDKGQATFTHELTHVLDEKVWFDGHARRKGQGAEVFARGLFEILDNSDGVSEYPPIFSLNLSYELGENRYQNSSPNRFLQESDLKEYFSGVMDVVYTLDYAEAKAILKKSKEDRAILLNKLELIDDDRRPDQVKDEFKRITVEEAENLSGINDFINNDLVSGRLEFKGVNTIGIASPNGYHVVPLFEPIYAGVQNDRGSVGDISFRRNAYELLAEYGYKNGMMSYISSKYPNDLEALNNIMPEYSGNFKEFKKAMFKKRVDKVDRLKATSKFSDFDSLQELMNEAIDTDLAIMKENINNSSFIAMRTFAVRNLKKAIYKEYLKATNDFRMSIYKDDEEGQEEDIEEVELPIETIEREDGNLWEDETREDLGSAGFKKVVKTYRTLNGKRVGEPTIREEKIKEMTPTIRYRGVKPLRGTRIEEEFVDIEIEREELTDETLYKGESRKEEGRIGRKKVTKTFETLRGEDVGEPSIIEEIITSMIKEKVYFGTKEKEVDNSENETENTSSGETSDTAGSTTGGTSSSENASGEETSENTGETGSKDAEAGESSGNTADSTGGSETSGTGEVGGDETTDTGTSTGSGSEDSTENSKDKEESETEDTSSGETSDTAGSTTGGTGSSENVSGEETSENTGEIGSKDAEAGESSGNTADSTGGSETSGTGEVGGNDTTDTGTSTGSGAEDSTENSKDKEESETEDTPSGETSDTAGSTTGGTGSSENISGGTSNTTANGTSSNNYSSGSYFGGGSLGSNKGKIASSSSGKSLKSIKKGSNTSSSLVSASGFWLKEKDYWRWVEHTGTYAKSKWLFINGHWYHFNKDAILDRSWYLDEANNWYYAIESGDKEGQILYSWFKDKDGHIYYLEESGKMAIGKKIIDGKEYYFSKESTKNNPLGSLVK